MWLSEWNLKIPAVSYLYCLVQYIVMHSYYLLLLFFFIKCMWDSYFLESKTDCLDNIWMMKWNKIRHEKELFMSETGNDLSPLLALSYLLSQPEKQRKFELTSCICSASTLEEVGVDEWVRKMITWCLYPHVLITSVKFLIVKVNQRNAVETPLVDVITANVLF